ncbi:MAG: ABC transporter permease [Nitrososphaerota archaeon]|nr:ABC transporter permease [Candidatus Bathyarchaeota archaeon]MDW8022840.1 ABC transporter permease [Nitrososphaerota archaeon]
MRRWKQLTKTDGENSKGGCRYKILLYNVVLVIVLLVVWEFAAKVFRSPFFPSFTEVVAAAFRIIVFGDIEGYRLSDHVFASIIRVLSGFGLACLTGFPTGLLMGLRREIYEASKPVIEPVRFIPPIAWLPIVFLLLSGYLRYIMIIWLGAFFPILLNTLSGVKRTDINLINVARVFGADGKLIILKVIIPSALPEVIAGMRIGLGVGWMCIVAAEMMGGDPVGLGRLIIKHVELLQIDASIVGIIFIGVIGLLMNEIFLQAEKRLFKWRVEVRV